jgi:hypothetical protein
MFEVVRRSSVICPVCDERVHRIDWSARHEMCKTCVGFYIDKKKPNEDNKNG